MNFNLFGREEDTLSEFNILDKIGYTFGDLGCGMIFGLMSRYLMLFYTDILGISAAAIGTVFLISKIWDAVNDPLLGLCLDKRKTSGKGKFKPCMIKFTFPMIIMSILTFTLVPGISDNLKVPYALFTYILFGMCYTCVNIPYGSMAYVISDNKDNIMSLSTCRGVASIVSQILILIISPRIIFNSENVATAQGFIKCIIFFSILSAISFLLNFKLTRERVDHKFINNSNNIRKTLKTLIRNRAFLGLALSTFTLMSSILTVSTLQMYLFKDYFKNSQLVLTFSIVSMSALVVSIILAGKIVKKFGKKETAVISSVLPSTMYIIMFFTPNLSSKFYMVACFISGLGVGIINTIIWALVSDAIDYHEYVSKERNEGTVYASYSCVRKLAQGFSGGLCGFVISFLEYKTNTAVQSDSFRIGIKNITLGIAAIGYLSTTLILIFVYNLSKKKVEEVSLALEEKRVA